MCLCLMLQRLRIVGGVECKRQNVKGFQEMTENLNALDDELDSKTPTKAKSPRIEEICSGDAWFEEKRKLRNSVRRW